MLSLLNFIFNNSILYFDLYRRIIMFLQYFALTLVISLFCLGLRSFTADGMIGHPIRLIFQKYAPYWGKPVMLCATCMSSFWGTVICTTLLFTLSLKATPILLLMWIGSSISSAFLNAVLWEYFQSLALFAKAASQ